ncbi:MAG: hypothetical protein NWQ32_04730 [Paracoccaceae bacterium]|nr:hypothetical protein [Paracoccaceae bacterium]
MGVLRADAGGMFDRAPIGLGPARDLLHIANQPVAIAAIDAVEFLQRVQIGQMMPVDADEIGAAHGLDAVDRKADPLVYGDHQVQSHAGDDQAVDQRRAEHHHRPCATQEIRQAHPERTMPAPGLFVEDDAAVFKAVAKGRGTAVEFGL